MVVAHYLSTWLVSNYNADGSLTHHYTSLSVKKKNIFIKDSPTSIPNSGFSRQQLNMNGSVLIGIAQNCTSVKKKSKPEPKMETRNSVTEIKICCSNKHGRNNLCRIPSAYTFFF